MHPELTRALANARIAELRRDRNRAAAAAAARPHRDRSAANQPGR